MRSLILRLLVLPLALVASGCESELDNLPTTPDPVYVTDTHVGELNINGAFTHSFFTSAPGTITATLTSLGDEPPAKVGFSMGTQSGSTCTVILRNDNAVVTSVITGSVSTVGGSLCVSIYDVGSLTRTTPYTITINHPQ